MKALKYTILVAAVAMVSCAANDESTERLAKFSAQVTPMNIVEVNDDESRGYVQISGSAGAMNFHYGWLAGERISVYDGEQSMANYNVLTTGTTCALTGSGFLLEPGKNYYAFSPYTKELNMSKVPVDYTGQNQSTNGNYSHLANYIYLYSTASGSTGDITNFVFHHASSILELQLGGLPAGTYKKLSIATESYIQKGTFDLSAQSATAITPSSSGSIELSLGGESGITISGGETLDVYVAVPAGTIGGGTKIFVTGDGSGMFSATINSQLSIGAGNIFLTRKTLTQI